MTGLSNHLAAPGCSAGGNHTPSITRWWGPTVNIRPALPQAVITVSYNYIWQTSNYQHNEAHHYSVCENEPWSSAAFCPRDPEKENMSVKHAHGESAFTQHRQQEVVEVTIIDWTVLLVWVTSGSDIPSERWQLVMQSSLIKRLPHRGSLLLLENSRTRVQVVQSKRSHTHSQTPWRKSDTSANGCLVTGCVRGVRWNTFN